MKRLFSVLVGIGLFLAWTTLRGGGGGSDDGPMLQALPPSIFEGGAGTISLEITTSQPAELTARFSRATHPDQTDEESVNVEEKMAPGSYSRSTSVSPDTYVFFQVDVPDATQGAQLSWVVRLDGKEILRESEHLDEPLRPGYAFFLQFEADDVAQMRRWR